MFHCACLYWSLLFTLGLSALTVWTCLPTKALNSWKRSCSLPSRRRKDLAKNRGRSPRLFLSFPLCCLIIQVKQTKKHNCTRNPPMYISYFLILNQILICSIDIAAVPHILYDTPSWNMQEFKHFFCALIENRSPGYFLISSPLLTGFLKRTESVFERILM